MAETTSLFFDNYLASFLFLKIQRTANEVEIPMMFIQADHDGYTNFTDFHSDMESVSGISNASVNLSSVYLTKIQEDYAQLIDIFAAHKEDVTGAAITTYIGSAVVIA